MEKWKCLSRENAMQWLREWIPDEEEAEVGRECLVRRVERKRWTRGPDGRLASNLN